jgi:hypothetical protein
MKSEELYNQWKRHKSQTEVGQDFSEKVMRRVYLYEQKKGEPLLNMRRFFDSFCTRPLAKTVVVAAAVIIGFARIAFSIYLFLRA